MKSRRSRPPQSGDGSIVGSCRQDRAALRRLTSFAAIAMLVLCSRASFGQTVDPTLTWGTDGSVLAIASTNTTLFVAGKFGWAGRVTGRFARLDATTGLPMLAFPGVDGPVETAVSDGSGGWFIGGSFQKVGGAWHQYLAHLLADGSVSTWSPSPGAPVHALALGGGTLYVGGAFMTMGGSLRSHLAAVDPGTAAVKAWNPAADGDVNAIALVGSTVLVGGAFDHVGGAAHHALGAVDVASGTATAFDAALAGGAVNVLVLGGSTLYAGGSFTTGGGSVGIAALDATSGAPAAGWSATTNAGGNVRALALSGATLYLGGDFSAIGGTPRGRGAALDASAGTLLAWNPAADAVVTALAKNGAVVYAGGSFGTIGGASRSRLAALDANSGNATAWNPAPNAMVRTLAVAGGDVFAGGDFIGVGGQARSNAAAFDIATGDLTAWDPAPNGVVQTLALSGAGIYAGGSFTVFGGQGRNSIAAGDTILGAATGWNPGANGRVSVLIADATTVYAGGSFTIIGSAPRNRLAALDAGTGSATAWDPNANSDVLALAIQNGTIYAGGSFTSMHGLARGRLASFRLGNSQPTAWAPSADNSVGAIAISGARVCVGGWFSTISGVPRAYLAALDTTLSTPLGWNPAPNGAVRSLVVRGTTLMAAGAFTSISATPRNFAAALSPVTVAIDTWDPNPDRSLNVLGVDVQRVFLGGGFSFVGSQTRANIAAVTPPAPVASPASVSIADLALPEGYLGTTSARLHVTLSAPSDLVVQVDYATADGSATAPQDYITTSGTLTFQPGDVDLTIPVSIQTDLTHEPDEAFVVQLANPVNATLDRSVAQCTILNDDPIPAITVADLQFLEGQGGIRAFTFTISLTNASSDPISVNYSTADGTATVADGDYVATSGTISIAPGGRTAMATVAVRGDLKIEPDEFFYLRLSNPVHVAFGDSVAVGTIQNDDAVSALSVNDVTHPEGSVGTTPFTFTITLAASAVQDATVDYATRDGTATAADGDYVPASGTATIATGTTTTTVTVLGRGDHKPEPTETFSLVLSNPSSAILGDSIGVGTIQNDDNTTPSFFVDDASVTEGNLGTKPLMFTIRLNTLWGDTLRVDYATADGTATVAGGDYVATSGTATILPEQINTTVAVPIRGDHTVEPSESFSLVLSNPRGAPLGDGVAVGTILNDDSAIPNLTVDDVSVKEGDSGVTPLVFTIRLNTPWSFPVSVDYATSDGTATLADDDYATASGTAIIPAESLATTVIVNVKGDTKPEPEERFRFDLSNASVTILRSSAIGSILTDEVDPIIASATDVPRDQGGWVWLAIDRAVTDSADATPQILTYNVWRKVDTASPSASRPAPAATLDPQRMLRPPDDATRSLLDGWPIETHERAITLAGGPHSTGPATAFPSGTWGIVGSFTAMQLPHYLVLAPTQTDSPAVAEFLLTAHTSSPSLWFVGPPATGQSVDNIPPEIPAPVAARSEAGGVDLTWGASASLDVDGYRIYRGESSRFALDSSTLRHQTRDLSWTDPAPGIGTYYYQVTAIDRAGNESVPASPPNPAIVNDDAIVPTAFAMHPPSPNPCRTSTALLIDLPQACDARVVLFDVTGRLVRELAAGPMSAGRHRVFWDGSDAEGRPAPAGLYLCRLTAGSFQAKSRIVRAP